MNSLTNTKQNVMMFLLVLITVPVFSQQNPIKTSVGIPLVTYARGVDSSWVYYIPPQQYDTIKSAGVNFIQVENMKQSQFETHIAGKGLMILPEQYFYNQQTDKYITYYTEGRYTEWPTVGTNVIDGKSTLKSLETHTEKYGGVLRTKQTNGNPLSHDTIVYGPQYWQDVYYRFHKQFGTTIQYTASFRLKLEELMPQESLPNDTICIIQVTAKDTYIKDVGFVTYLPVYVIKQRAVTYGELLPLNSYKTFSLTYTLDGVPDSISDQPLVGSIIPQWSKRINGKTNEFAAVNNIEFRIIWKSNSEILRLYMDTIKVFDSRGYDIMNNAQHQQLIIDQVNLAAYKNSVAGWMSVDEPMSIDQMAPMKKVNELIESVQPNTGLWVNFNSDLKRRYIIVKGEKR